jgi:hypothetical protein
MFGWLRRDWQQADAMVLKRVTAPGFRVAP